MTTQAIAPGLHAKTYKRGASARNTLKHMLDHAMRDERDVGKHANKNVIDSRIGWNRNFVFDESVGDLVPGTREQAMERYFELYGTPNIDDEIKRAEASEIRKWQTACKKAREDGLDLPPRPKAKRRERDLHTPQKRYEPRVSGQDARKVSAVTLVLQPSREWLDARYPEWREATPISTTKKGLWREKQDVPREVREQIEKDLMAMVDSSLEAMGLDRSAVLGLSLNMDETSPHAQFAIAPLEELEDGRLVQCWNRIAGDKEKLALVHDRYRENLRERGYEVTDERITGKGSMTSAQYGRMRDEMREEARKEVEQKLADRIAFVEGRVEDHNRRTNEILVGERRNRAKEQELDEREKAVEGLEAEKAKVAEDREANRRWEQELAEQARENAAERERLKRQERELNEREDEVRASAAAYDSGISEVAEVLPKLMNQESMEAQQAREMLERRKRMPKAPAPQKRPPGTAPQKRAPGSAPQKRPFGSAPKLNRGQDDDFELG